MKLTIPIQSLLAPQYFDFVNICSRVRDVFLQLEETHRLEILRHVHGKDLEYAERVLPFHAITRSVVTEICRMACQIQERQFNGLGPYQNETLYPSIEIALDFNDVQCLDFFENNNDMKQVLLNRSALLQYLINNGETVLVVEIQK